MLRRDIEHPHEPYCVGGYGPLKDRNGAVRAQACLRAEDRWERRPRTRQDATPVGPLARAQRTVTMLTYATSARESWRRRARPLVWQPKRGAMSNDGPPEPA